MKRHSIWMLIIISAVTLAFIATGCAKKQMVKEESAAKPVAQVQKETPKPVAKPAPAPAAEKPKEQAQAVPPAQPKAKAQAPAVTPAPLNLRDETIWFAFDDYNLSSRARANLEQIASWMSKNPGVKIQIQGNTCDIGTAEYNLALGDRRAASAKKYLEGLGAKPQNLSTISYGEEKPVVPNTDEANRSKNRRDDFVLAK